MARRVATSDTIKESAQKAVPEMQNVSSVVQTTVVQTTEVQKLVVQTTVVQKLVVQTTVDQTKVVQKTVVQTIVVQTIVVQIIVVQTTVVPRNIQKGSELKLFLFDWQGVLEDQRAQEKIENQTS